MNFKGSWETSDRSRWRTSAKERWGRSVKLHEIRWRCYRCDREQHQCKQWWQKIRQQNEHPQEKVLVRAGSSHQQQPCGQISVSLWRKRWWPGKQAFAANSQGKRGAWFGITCNLIIIRWKFMIWFMYSWDYWYHVCYGITHRVGRPKKYLVVILNVPSWIFQHLKGFFSPTLSCKQIKYWN